MDRQHILLTRLGQVKLISFLGEPTVQALQALSIENIGAAYLASLMEELYGKRLVIDRKDIRSAIFNGLSREDAKELCKLLGLPTLAPWTELSDAKFGPGSQNLSTLTNWLGLDEWDILPIEDDENSITPIAHITPDYPLFEHQIRAVSRVNNALHSDDGTENLVLAGLRAKGVKDRRGSSDALRTTQSIWQKMKVSQSFLLVKRSTFWIGQPPKLLQPAW